MIIPDDICQTIKELFVIIIPTPPCKSEFADHLWLPFLDQQQRDVLVFAIISLHIY